MSTDNGQNVINSDENNNNSAAEIKPQTFTLPDEVEDYIFISKYFCDATNAVLQTIHNDIKVLCADDYSTDVDYGSDRRVATEISNMFRRVYNSTQNNNKAKIVLHSNNLQGIPTYLYDNTENKFETGSGYYNGGPGAGEGGAFIKRSDLIERKLLKDPLAKKYTYEQKLNYFYAMIMLAYYDDKRTFWKNDAFTSTLNTLQNEVSDDIKNTQETLLSNMTGMNGWKKGNTWTGGKRTKKRPNRKRKSTKRRRGTRKRTNKKR